MQLIIQKIWAEIKEIIMIDQKTKKEMHNDDVLRVWCTSHPDVFKFQIRTYKPINAGWKKGKSRNMIATISLTIKEVENILKYMKAEKDRQNRRLATDFELLKARVQR